MKKREHRKTQFTSNDGVRAKKALGQHFLTNPRILENIADVAEVHSSLPVVEIGPGRGALTEELLKKTNRLITVEKDGALIPLLEEKFANEIQEGKLSVVLGDIRAFIPEEYGLKSGKYHLVANIPYYITGEILRIFLAHSTHPKDATLLVQKEVAQRITKDKKESVLSLSVKAYGTPSIAGVVNSGSFSPPPKVDSAILRIENISKDSFEDVSEEAFFAVVKMGFKSKRKMLRGNLSSFGSPEYLKSLFMELALPWEVRAEDVPLSRWLSLTSKLKSQAESS